MCWQCIMSEMAGSDPSSLQIWLFLAGGGCLRNPLLFAPAGRRARAAPFPAGAPWHSRVGPILGLTGCTRGCPGPSLPTSFLTPWPNPILTSRVPPGLPPTWSPQLEPILNQQGPWLQPRSTLPPPWTPLQPPWKKREEKNLKNWDGELKCRRRKKILKARALKKEKK